MSAPVEFYDAAHGAFLQRMDGKIEGLLVHIGRPTPRGFEVIEVWESRQHFERCLQEVVNPMLADLFEGQAPPVDQSDVEFDVRGLVIPAAQIFK